MEAIKTRKLIVELDDGTEVSKVRRRTRKGEEVVRLPTELEDAEQKGIISNKPLVCRETTLEPQRKTMALVTTERLGVMVIKPHNDLY